MMKRFLFSFMVGLCFALPAGFLAVVAVEAQTPSPETVEGGECEGCHQIIHSHWEESAHGNAVSDPVFQEAWKAQGSPDSCLACHTTGFDSQTGTYDIDSVSCTVCHSPVPENHPNQIMPTDISSRMCGDCHLDTYAEWESSTHAQEDLACSRCHGVHGTDIKAEAAQELCRACHREEVHFFSYTAHFDEGLLCTDCHLQISGTQMGEGHGQRKHTFTADLETCAECHQDQMHYPSPERSEGTQAQSSLLPNVEGAEVLTQPEPVSPLGYAVLAALIGMAFGMLVAPWLERWYRHINLTK